MKILETDQCMCIHSSLYTLDRPLWDDQDDGIDSVEAEVKNIRS
jgi:hypothetical protein